MSENRDGIAFEKKSEAFASDTAQPETIELLEEVLRVAKRTVERGTVRVSVLTETEEQTVSETLNSRQVNIERRKIGRRLGPDEAVPQSRTEGNVLVVPVVEEVLVIEKRLVITEELHIRIVSNQQPFERTLPLRRQRAVIENIPAPDHQGTP